MNNIFVFLRNAFEIQDEDFNNPTRHVVLPSLTQEAIEKIGTDNRLIMIKKSVFDKNRKHHNELTPDDSRKVLNAALTSADLIINDKPSNKPNYWIVVNLDKNENAVLNVDIDSAKQFIEVVGWRKVRDRSIEQIKNRAIREGGQVLMTQKGAAGLSALTDNSVSGSKDTDNI